MDIRVPLAMCVIAGTVIESSARQGPPPPPTAVAYRSFDGTGNNPSRATWGIAGARYLREASGTHYADGRSTPAGGGRPSPRVISNALAAQGDVETADSRGLSTAVYEFGQFLDHDLGLALGGSTEPLSIAVPLGDPWFDPFNTGTQTIGFYRSGFDPATGVNSPREQVNTVTAFIDASQIYGSDAARAAWLRTGIGGHMKVSRQSFGDMLPYNDGTLANDNPLRLPATALFAAGDVRANEQIGLTVLHTVFLREHNWQADRLQAEHPQWNDERLYQEARRWVGAEMQSIIYNDWFPAITGRRLPPYRGFNRNINPGLSNMFAAAAYRIGHSMVGPDIDLLDENLEEVGVLELADAFFNPLSIANSGGLEPVARYFAASTQQETDTMIVDGLRNFLFGPPGAGGLDLASLNIQRGRDHGLADYNTVRRDYGLPPVQSFGQITRNTARADTLRLLYGNVNTIDAWVGLLSEDHLPGSSIGPAHMAILTDQFMRLRDGDRYWYQNIGLSRTDLDAIEATHLSTIIKRTTGVTRLQDDIFFADENPPPVPPCAADFDDSGAVDGADVSAFFAAWESGDAAADVNGDGGTDGADIGTFFALWEAGGC